jgi:hypothetical protein
MNAGMGGAVVVAGDRQVTERIATVRYARSAAVVRPVDRFAEPLAAVVVTTPPPQAPFWRGRQPAAAFAAQALDGAAMDHAPAVESPAERAAGHYRAALSRVAPQPGGGWRFSVIA